MVAQTPLASRKYIDSLPFFVTDIGDANGTLFGQATTPLHVAHSRGSIVGFSGTLNGTLTTGTLTLQATINGSLCPAFNSSTALVHLYNNGSYFMQPGRKANYTFAAGDKIGLIWNKTATVDPTTRDGNFQLVVLYEGVQL